MENYRASASGLAGPEVAFARSELQSYHVHRPTTHLLIAVKVPYD